MDQKLFRSQVAGDAAASEFASTVATPQPALDELARRIHPGLDLVVDGPPSDLDSLPQAPGLESEVERRPTISHIGRYALKGLIGEGGLGQVYEAWDPLLSRTVAVKTLQFDVDMPSRISLDRLFLNEARAAAGLSHPNIVTVHDAGLSAHGVYIAMERLHGCDLRQRLAEGWRPSAAQAARLVRRLADALAYAHEHGVVHCDIKPANIFLNPRDKPKLLDFGIARVAHGTALPALDDAIAGSPHYLAPEQLAGGPVDARTDVHALGVVFYELLALRRAYAGDRVGQIAQAILHEPPPLADEVNPEVPRRLALIAAKAMAPNAADRHASAAEFAADLRRWMSQHPSADATGTSPALAADAGAPGAAAGRRQRWITVAAAGTLALATAAGLAWHALGQTPDAKAAETNATPAPAKLSTAAGAAAPDRSRPAAAPVAQAKDAGAAAEAAPTPSAAPAAFTALSPHGSARPPTRSPARATAATARRTAAGLQAPLATGVLRLAISPWGQVEVDGAPIGTTPPMTQLTLTEGEHRITLRNGVAPAYTATVQIGTGAPATLRYHFGP
ncbi:MAG: serine/threonine protein kinase [Burkholderiales bacterium]|nr:serine/threonine protein kinase [Burkholderiales bacterium]